MLSLFLDWQSWQHNTRVSVGSLPGFMLFMLLRHSFRTVATQLLAPDLAAHGFKGRARLMQFKLVTALSSDMVHRVVGTHWISSCLVRGDTVLLLFRYWWPDNNKPHQSQLRKGALLQVSHPSSALIPRSLSFAALAVLRLRIGPSSRSSTC